MNIGMSPKIAEMDIQDRLASTLGEVPSNIRLCRIDDVNTKSMTVSVTLLGIQKVYRDVSYLFPYYNKGTGIIFVPSKDSMGIVGFDNHNVPFLMGFVAPFTSEYGKSTHTSPKFGDYNFPDISEGDILLSSAGRGLLHIDKFGNIKISSSLLASTTYTYEGDVITECENADASINGKYTEDYSNDFTDYLKVTTGEHNISSGNCEDDVIQLNYSIQDTRTHSFIGFDKDGNIHLSGKIISHDRSE